MSKISELDHAVNLLNNQSLVAIPTETVYGLAGNIYSEQSIRQIFELKQRPLKNPLIVHIKSINELEKVAVAIPAKARVLANSFWPGPLTLVLKKQSNVLDVITAGKDTVAVRVPNHPLALELLQKLDFPLAAPSANPFGCISPTRADHVKSFFDADKLFVLDGGPCNKGIESTIIGFEDDQPVLYRAGATSISDIEALVGPLKIYVNDDVAPVAPGMLSKHYAPATPTILSTNIKVSLLENSNKRIGLLSFCKIYEHPSIVSQILLSERGNLDESAQRLYALLHDLDQKELDLIIVEKVPNLGIGVAINDKLQRASVV